MKISNVLYALGIVMLSGCGALQGKLDYEPPDTQNVTVQNSKEINKSREDVWASAVPRLGKQFFVINNIDKASGLINVSYSGDPSKYVDCGTFTSFVKNLKGERTYRFAGGSAYERYEMLNYPHLLSVDRKVELEGRVNLIFEEVGPTRTKVTANTSYLVTKSAKATNATGGPAGTLGPDATRFTTQSVGTFSPAGHVIMKCKATGRLEQDLLDLVN